jgi:hypothetical protein
MENDVDKYLFYERFNGPKQGYCRLCGKLAPLTLDHIPPSSWCNTQNILLQSFIDKKLEMKSSRGLMFQSICADCNNHLLGSLDQEVGLLLNEMRSYLRYMEREGVYRQKIQFNISYGSLIKCIIGHILSGFDPIKSVEFPIYKPKNSFKDILHKYWNSEIDYLPERIKIYYWLYSRDRITFAPQLVYAANIADPTSIITCSLLRFTPIGIMICDLDKSAYRFKLQEMDTKNKKKKVILDLKMTDLPEDYPFTPQKNSGILFNKNMIYFGLKHA